MQHEPSAMTFDELRGATLDRVTVDWRNAVVMVSFLPAHSRAEAHALRATAFVRVEIPRGVGASKRVREVRAHAGGGSPAHPHAVDVELESGETIRIEAERIALEPQGG